MPYENILYEVSDRIARITLNRPEKLNALSRALLTEYADAMHEAERDRDVRVVIVRAVPADKLEAEVEKLAARIALVDPTLLAMNKLAVNRVFEEMGMRTVFDAAISLDTIAHTAEAMQEFNRISREQGLKSALEANEGPFRQSPRPF